MANTYKNIVITPNVGSSSDDPKVVLSGGNTSTNTDITLRVYPASNGTVSFEGSAGQLFSITNDLSGVIYSINDVSGIPSMTVYSDGDIELAKFNGNLTFGTATSNNIFNISSKFTVNTYIRRLSSGTGYLEGYYSNAETSNTTGAIYTIGGSYQPSATSLNNMYGIGYSVGNSTANPGLGQTGWGLYAASNGTSRVFLDSDNGVVISSGSTRSPIFYDSNDTGYYADPAGTSVFNRISTVRTNNWLYIDNNYGHSVVGVYDSYRLQGVFAMGDSYKLAADGLNAGNLYGLAWSHPNAGALGGASNLNDHGLLIINNGSFRAALSSRAVFSSDVRGTLFYDYDDTGYYVDPNSTTRLNNLTVTGTVTGISAGATLSNDTTTNSNGYYPAMATSTSGSWTTAYVSSTKLYFNPSTGTLNATIFNSLSDRRYKENINQIQNGLNIVEKLIGVSYNFIGSSNKEIGFVAQDVVPYVPEVVTYIEELDQYGINYGNIAAILVEAIKELNKEIKTIKQKLRM